MSTRVTCTIADGVADVRLNRPEKRNAIDLAMFDALIDTGLAVAANPEVRAVVLSGEGRSFCAGLDMAIFQALGHPEAGTAARGDPAPGAGAGPEPPPASVADAVAAPALARRPGQVASVAQQAVTVWRDVPVPVIAALHGHSLGGGFQLALGADIRVVAPDTVLSALEVRWGLIPDMSGTVVLPTLVGVDVAKELTFTGRMISGEEAYRLGLATRLSEHPLEDARALAAEMAGNSPDAVRAAKALFNRAGPGPAAEDFDQGLRAEQAAQRRLIGSPNQIEAVLSYLERRPARWAPPGSSRP